LLDGDGARFVEPPKIGRKTGDGRLAKHPGPRVVHVLEQPLDFAIDIRRCRRWGFQVWTKLGVGRDVAFGDERRGASKDGGVGRVAADLGQCPKLLERAPERNVGRPARIGRNRALAFQCAGLRRRLARRFLRFRRQVRANPLADAALERGRSIAFPNQLGGDARAGQLVRIGIVDDDVAVAWQRWLRSVSLVPNGAWQLDRAVFVRVLQTGVDQDRSVSGLDALL